MSRRLASFSVLTLAASFTVNAGARAPLPVIEPAFEPVGAVPSPCDEFSCYKRAVLDGDRFAAVGQGYAGVYVFVRNRSGDWAFESVLPTPEPSVYVDPPGGEAPDPMEFDPEYGLALALEGNDLLVSHNHYDQPSETYDPRVYVYRRRGSTWTHTQTVDETCGGLTALSVEGGTALLGACVFERNRLGRYTFAQRLQSADGQAFGYPVAFDGHTAVFGAVTADANVGAAYVFERFRFGWRQVQRLVPADGVPNTGFATALAVGGGTLAIGAPSAAGDVPERPGVVYVYTRGVWSFRPTQVLDNPFPFDEAERGVFRPFGTAVATEFGRVLAGGEVWYPYADFLPMVYLYQSRWGRFVPKAVLSAGRASGLFLDRGWALVDVTGLRTGTFPVLFELR